MHPPVKSRRPEDAELARKLEELAELQSRLAELELQLLTLRLELNEFESLYCAKVGSLYVSGWSCFAALRYKSFRLCERST
jgi:hypothetical protein